jgi:cell division protein YceG involved in septum cleavage
MSKTGFQTFAAGMIVATSLLGGTYLLSDNKSAEADAEKKEVTNSDVESFLTSNGKVSISTDEYEELLAAKDKAVQQQDTKTAEETPQQEENTAEEKKEEVVKYSVTIKSGMTTSEISDLLEQNGIIEDSFDFDQFLIKGNYHQKVQLGTFTVQKGMTYNQLAEVLTK